jgi:hypothetical protein
MQIKVLSAETPRVEQDLHVSSLTFSLKSSTFEIPAGGYLIKSPEPFVPISLHVHGSICSIRFETRQAALEFCDWLRGANEQASDSFTRMLD